MNLLFSQNLEIFSQLILAAILGVLIGTEREFRGKSAGVRTHSLVCLAACLFTILSVSGFKDFITAGASFDPSRVASQIIVGIGFLGAGLIILQQNQTQGLTTAAGVWVTTAIGMTIGLKMYIVGLFATFLVLLIFTILFYFELFVDRFRKNPHTN